VRLDVDRATDEERDAALSSAIAAEGRLALLIDRPDVADAQRALVDLASVRDPSALPVNVRLPARHPLPLPVVLGAAARRGGAGPARALLLRRCRASMPTVQFRLPVEQVSCSTVTPVTSLGRTARSSSGAGDGSGDGSAGGVTSSTPSF